MTREKKLTLILAFNILLMTLEVGGGIVSRSLALLSDAGHMLTDSFAVMLGLTALYLAKKPASAKNSFGYHRAEIIASLLNGLLLVLISGYIFYEAAQRFFNPVEVKTGILITVASIGLAGNILAMWLLHSDSRSSLNIKGVFFHILGDTLSSLGVIAGGIVIAFTGWNIVDPLIGLMIGGIVLRSAYDLIVESGEVLLEAAPRDIDPAQVKATLESIPGIREFHDVHIWSITSEMRALSGHILTDDITTSQSQLLLEKARELLHEKFNISHTTLEVECSSCTNNSCPACARGDK